MWPGDNIWRQRSCLTLVQEIACCLTAPSHYLNQNWLTLSEVLWHFSEGHFIGNTQGIYLWSTCLSLKWLILHYNHISQGPINSPLLSVLQGNTTDNITTIIDRDGGLHQGRFSFYGWARGQSFSMIVPVLVNTLRPRQNGHHFPDIFKCIFLNENVWISIKISLKFFPKGPIDNILSLVQMMACCQPGGKPLSEPMMFNLLTHIWLNSMC